MAIESKRVGDHRTQIVMAAGAASTLLAFALVFALAKSGTNIMGWYANYVLPVGALLVGAVAASGYAIAAWFTGLRMTTRLTVSVVGQLVVSYFIAQYEAFHVSGVGSSGMGFFEWFDLSTRAFSFSSRNGSPGDPLGAVGYLFRLFEIAGFVVGGAIVPAALHDKAYCEPCRSYKRTSMVAVIPGIPMGGEETDGPYADPAQRSIVAIFDAAAAGERAALQQAIDEHGPLAKKRETMKLAGFTRVNLVRCPRCAQSELSAIALERGDGSQYHATLLGGASLPGDQVRVLFD